MAIKGVIFDFIGTTVIEKDPSMLNRCFAEAFNDHGAMVDIELIKANRGKDKMEMITDILNQMNFPLHLVHPVLNSFKTRLENNLDNFCENEGAGELFASLEKREIRIGLGTGLPRDTFENIFRHINWSTIFFDYIGIAGETGRGRPHPDMILDMMKKCKLENTELIKVGDTVADILEGKNAKVITVAILSGTQSEKELRDQRPDFIIHSLAELKQIINEDKLNR